MLGMPGIIIDDEFNKSWKNQYSEVLPQNEGEPKTLYAATHLAENYKGCCNTKNRTAFQ